MGETCAAIRSRHRRNLRQDFLVGPRHTVQRVCRLVRRQSSVDVRHTCGGVPDEIVRVAGGPAKRLRRGRASWRAPIRSARCIWADMALAADPGRAGLETRLDIPKIPDRQSQQQRERGWLRRRASATLRGEAEAVIDYRNAGRHRRRQRDASAAFRSLARVRRSRPACCRISDRSAACSASIAIAIASRCWRPSADGVGTKLKVAFMTGRHDTVGARPRQPLRATTSSCRAPIRCSSSTTSRTGGCRRRWRSRVVAGVARGLPRERLRSRSAARRRRCRDSTPTANTTSPASSSASSSKSKHRFDGRGIRPGDALIGLPSAGLHTNGYSLARKICFEVAGWTPDTFVPELGATVGDALLAPHRSYLSLVRPLLDQDLVKGLAHITGGGITENLPRISA